jgi:hypothetical protein
MCGLLLAEALEEEQPLNSEEPVDKKGTQSSIIIIFSVWKTMIGTAVVSLPWAFQ